jgi:hypothetical protein
MDRVISPNGALILLAVITVLALIGIVLRISGAFETVHLVGTFAGSGAPHCTFVGSGG